jgi:hypothetical protein
VIQDETSLIEEIDHTVMARLYEYQAMAIDPNLMKDYREHYYRRLVAVRNELNVMLEEIGRAN